MSNAAARTFARDTITALADLGDQITTFTGIGGAVDTVGYIDDAPDIFGGEVLTMDPRQVATLLIEDVGSPSRGDTVTDEEGVNWELVEEMDRRAWVTDWTVQRL